MNKSHRKTELRLIRGGKTGSSPVETDCLTQIENWPHTTELQKTRGGGHVIVLRGLLEGAPDEVRRRAI